MTQLNNKTIEGITEVLMASGFEKAVPQIMEIVLNTAMRAERETFLKAQPYERTDDRIDVANGFKPKQIKNRVGGPSRGRPLTPPSVRVRTWRFQ